MSDNVTTISSFLQAAKFGSGGHGGAGAEGSEQRIAIDTDTELQDEYYEILKARVAATKAMFAHGPRIVEIDTTEVPKLFSNPEHTVPTTTTAPVAINRVRIVKHLRPHASFFKEFANGSRKAMPVPDWMASFFIGETSRGLPPLAGIIRHPVLDDDNNLVRGQTGYDEKTQFYFDAPLAGDPDQIPITTIPNALLFLRKGWLGEFPFATDDDFHRAILLCITLLKARLCLAHDEKYPAFIVTAPMASSGKSKLIETICEAILGSQPMLSAYPDQNEEEMAKLLISVAMADPAAFCFDNIANGTSIKGAILDNFITNAEFGARKLGVSEHIQYPALPVVLATGNNVETAEDSASRWLEIRLVPLDSTPQLREFKRDVRKFTREYRCHILRSLALIAGADTSQQEPVKARFGKWARVVAGPVMAATGSDTMLDAWREEGTTIRNADALGEFLEKLAEKQDHLNCPEGLTAADVIKYILPEYETIANLKPEILADAEEPDLVAFNKLDDDAKRLLKAKREKAMKTIARGIGKRMKPYKDQIAAGFRLRIIPGAGRSENRKRVTIYHAENAVKADNVGKNPPF